MSHLDFYTDVEPNRDYDIYSMSDEPHMCHQTANQHHRDNNARKQNEFKMLWKSLLSFQKIVFVILECFFRAIDLTRFFKSIVRDSLTVRSVGECEMECIKTTKFTCRAFSFR